jgi:hypothetical protein
MWQEEGKPCSESECAFEHRFETTEYRLKAMNTEFFIVIALDIGDISIERCIVHRILAKPTPQGTAAAALWSDIMKHLFLSTSSKAGSLVRWNVSCRRGMHECCFYTNGPFCTEVCHGACIIHGAPCWDRARPILVPNHSISAAPIQPSLVGLLPIQNLTAVLPFYAILYSG